MEDFSVPSFSLGIDIDIADLPTEGEEEEEAGRPGLQPCPDQRQGEEESLRKSSIQEWEEIGGHESLGEAQEEEPPPRALKRLKRGPPSSSLTAACSSRPSAEGGDLTHESPPLYDDIEEFSSPDKDPKRCSDDYPSTQSHITCSNTKFSLLHRGFLKDNSQCKHRAYKVPDSSCFSTLTGLDARNEKYTIPRLTISPIRRINLIDSDSDDSSNSKDKCRKNEVTTGVSLKKVKHFHEVHSAWEAKKSFLASKCQKESFWKDFSPTKNNKLETPALDEFCKEYFRSARDQNENHIKGEIKSSCFGKSSGFNTVDLIDGNNVLNSPNNFNGEVDKIWGLPSPQPPAYQYFYHTDPRIKTLVRQHLPHFVLLGMKNNTEAQHFGAESLDYIGQFSPTFAGGKANNATEKLSRANSSKKQNKKSSNVIEASGPAGSWVNPRFKATVPKDAGKRRVSADVHQSGHWFTEQDGRKVYVSKDGEKSTGRAAYAKYRKESGGFRKAKRKSAGKKSKKVRR